MPPRQDQLLGRWRAIALAASLIIVLSIPAYVVKKIRSRAPQLRDSSDASMFVGRDKCIGCHQAAYQAWKGSDHDLAMAVATDSTVLGDFEDASFEYRDMRARFYKKNGKFFVHTQGPGGDYGDFEIAYTFGVEPLQQYLIPFPGGRLQALSIAWDTERDEWFYLYPGRDIPPDDWLHWTRNAQNWNGMCAECHSTNLIKNYDSISKSFSTTWSEIDVSCEACHGPGSRHVEWAEMPPMARPEVANFELVVSTDATDARRRVELCAPCHSRRSELGDYDHARANLLDNIAPSVLEEGLYFADGQILDEVYVYGSFVQSKMYRNNIKCGDCHDVHSLKLKKNGNDLCLDCHQAEVYDSYDHHFHKKEHDGKPSEGHLCVKCHMPERPYMVVDWRADHSLRVPRPDLTIETGVPNACGQSGCHDDKPAQWAAEHYTTWYGRARKPHYGTILAAGRRRDPGARDPLIRLAGDPLHPAIVRATALSLLGSYPGDNSTAAFSVALSDDDALVRYTAVQNLNPQEPGELVELAAPLLSDPVRGVRMQAASRLAGLDGRFFKPYQIEARDQALAEYKSAMEYSLDFSFAAHNLGNLYLALDQRELAERYYKTAVEIDDLFFPAKANLAVMYNSMGRNEEAERLLREILVAYPDHFETAYSLGLLLAEMNRYEEAVTYLQKAAGGMPDRPRVFYNLGLMLQALGRPDEAERALLRAVDLEPDNLDHLHALADHFIKRGEPAKALSVADRMIATRPEDPRGRNIREFIERTFGPDGSGR